MNVKPVVFSLNHIFMFCRYCCECGRFSVIAFVWYSMCIFQVGWGLAGLHWIVKEVFFMDGTPESKLTSLPTYVTFLEVTLASVVLDLTLAGQATIPTFGLLFHDKIHWFERHCSLAFIVVIPASQSLPVAFWKVDMMHFIDLDIAYRLLLTFRSTKIKDIIRGHFSRLKDTFHCEKQHNM